MTSLVVELAATRDKSKGRRFRRPVDGVGGELGLRELLDQGDVVEKHRTIGLLHDDPRTGTELAEILEHPGRNLGVIMTDEDRRSVLPGNCATGPPAHDIGTRGNRDCPVLIDANRNDLARQANAANGKPKGTRATAEAQIADVGDIGLRERIGE